MKCLASANFRNEIIWKRRVGMSSAVHESNGYGVCTDEILFYVKSEDAQFIPQYNADSPEYQEYIKTRFTYVDEKGRHYQLDQSCESKLSAKPHL